jgi:hypothetical protein
MLYVTTGVRSLISVESVDSYVERLGQGSVQILVIQEGIWRSWKCEDCARFPHLNSILVVVEESGSGDVGYFCKLSRSALSSDVERNLRNWLEVMTLGRNPL